MTSAFHPDFGQAVNYRFDVLPEDGDGQVRETVKRMIEYIRADAQSPYMKDAARECLNLGAGNPIVGAWSHIKPSIRFQQDVDTAAKLETPDPRKESIVEVLIRPVDQRMLILLRGIGVEDCDGFEMYAACILHALGIPVALVTISADPDDPNRLSHVYLAAYVNGQRIPLDFSHGPYPGWEAPNTGRQIEWAVFETWHERVTNLLWPAVLIAGAWYGWKYLRSAA